MKYALAIVQLAFGLALFLCATVPAYPHGGGLDDTTVITTGKPAVITVIVGRSPGNPSPRRTRC